MVFSIGNTKLCYADEVNTPALSNLILETIEQISAELAEQDYQNELNEVRDIACSYLGTPYVYGGTTPRGFDCSGFVQYVYKQYGISISRTTYTQINCGTRVSTAELQVGDLVFFSGLRHVGMYIGEGQYIHAPQTGDVVKIDNIADRTPCAAVRLIERV